MVLLFKLLVLTLLIWPMARAIWLHWYGSKSRSWKPVNAEIAQVQLNQKTDDDGVTTYTPHISYKYKIRDREFTSSRIAYGNFGTASYEQALGSLSGLNVGKPITAYFDPDKPERAVLVIGPPRASPIDFLVAIALITLICSFFFGHSA